MMNNETANHFDEKAKSWDEEPRRVAMGAAIARAAAARLPAERRARLMDYGCGTGLCCLPLAGHCSTVLGVDSSAGMLARLAEKAHAAGLEHVTTLRHDLAAAPLTGMEFDVVLCAMTLHHVREVGPLLDRFYSLLVPGGLLALADLDQEDGTFHQDPRGVEHHGFSRDGIRKRLQAAGFAPVNFEKPYVIERPTESGELRRYPVFLATAEKPGR